MRKNLLIAFVVMLLLMVLTACTKESIQRTEEAVSSMQNPSVHDVSAEVSPEPAPAIQFTDRQLEEKIREMMNKPEGDIMMEEAAAVTSLNLSNKSFDDMNAKDGGIKDISDLQYFTGLMELNLAFNNISNLTPLSSLKKLETLDISGTQVDDLSPLNDIKNIKCLVFCWLYSEHGPNGIGNLEALAGLTNLEMVDAKNAGITNVSALSGLPKLWEVQLNDNQITDITPLASVKSLKVLLLAGNPIADYSPLKDIYPQLEGKDFEMK